MPDGSKRTGAGWKGRGADHTRGGQPGFAAAANANFMLIGRRTQAAGSIRAASSEPGGRSEQWRAKSSNRFQVWLVAEPDPQPLPCLRERLGDPFAGIEITCRLFLARVGSPPVARYVETASPDATLFGAGLPLRLLVSTGKTWRAKMV